MRTIPCTCSAYPFPHRPGGGKCGYLDAAARMREMYGYWLDLEEYTYFDDEDVEATVHAIACEHELAPTARYWQLQYADMF